MKESATLNLWRGLRVSVFMGKSKKTLGGAHPKFTFSEHPNAAKYDWRLQAVTTIAQPFRAPSGHVFNVGDVAVVSCPVEYDSRTYIHYNMPSVCGMLLDYSHRLWSESQDILSLFTQGKGTALEPKMLTDRNEDGPNIELLERRMGSVVFAYTALEAFANEVMEEAYGKHGYVYSQPKKDGSQYSISDIERYLSLAEKLNGVLPEICGVKPVKQNSVLWPRFRHLETIRHFVVHPKLPDRIQSNPKAPVLWKKLSDDTFRDFSLVAKDVMMHFAGNGQHQARWLFRCPF